MHACRPLDDGWVVWHAGRQANLYMMDGWCGMHACRPLDDGWVVVVVVVVVVV